MIWRRLSKRSAKKGPYAGPRALTVQETLTHYIHTLTYRFPEITFVILGGLAVHFAIVYATHGKE